MESPIGPGQQLRQGNNQQYYNQQQIPMLKSESGVKGFSSKIFNNKGLLILIAILQIIIIILLFINPLSLINNIQTQQIINEVASKITVNTSQTPEIATITDAASIREENGANAQVYKDAQNGDYVLGYEDKLIIYRRSTGEIIYEGDNPTALVNNAQQKLVDDITTKTKELSLISEDSEEVPQISLVTDVATLQAQNSEFYSVARNNDIVALFAESGLIVLYNQESETIVNSGRYSTNITSL